MLVATSSHMQDKLRDLSGALTHSCFIKSCASLATITVAQKCGKSRSRNREGTLPFPLVRAEQENPPKMRHKAPTLYDSVDMLMKNIITKHDSQKMGITAVIHML